MVHLHRCEAEVHSIVGAGHLLEDRERAESSERDYRRPDGPPKPLGAVEHEEHEEHERHVLEEQHETLHAGRWVLGVHGRYDHRQRKREDKHQLG